MNERELVSRLIEKEYKISIAESCTGGLFASKIVSVPDASKVLDMSFVTYSNEAKESLLGVSNESLKNYGAVSEAVAREMAEGVKRVSNSNVGVGITGIAGPTGGTPQKPVGTVWFGFCVNGQTIAKMKLFSGDRNVVRKKSVDFAIKTLLKLL